MLANQFLQAADGARTPAVLDELARKLWRAHAEGHLADADAEAISEAVEARRGPLPREVTGRPLKATRYLGGKVPFGFRRGESGDLPTWHSAAQPASTEIMSAADAPGTL